MNNVITQWYVLHPCTELDGGVIVTEENQDEYCNSAPETCMNTWWHTEEQHLNEPHQIQRVSDGAIINLDKSNCYKEYLY